MKKLAFCMTTLLLVFSVMTASANQTVSVYVNGAVLESDAPAVIVNDRTMLPLRALFNALGVSDDAITWDPSARSIEIHMDGTFIFMAIDSPYALVNDQMTVLETAPYLEGDRTMLPLRFVSENLGATVDWNEETQTVSITK